jgi:hypothetical protein
MKNLDMTKTDVEICLIGRFFSEKRQEQEPYKFWQKIN